MVIVLLFIISINTKYKYVSIRYMLMKMMINKYKLYKNISIIILEYMVYGQVVQNYRLY